MKYHDDKDRLQKEVNSLKSILREMKDDMDELEKRVEVANRNENTYRSRLATSIMRYRRVMDQMAAMAEHSRTVQRQLHEETRRRVQMAEELGRCTLILNAEFERAGINLSGARSRLAPGTPPTGEDSGQENLE